MSKKVNVTFEGKVIGTAHVNDDGVVEMELEAEDLKHILPEGDLTKSLSIAFADEFRRQNPPTFMVHYPAPWEPREKGTFDA